MRNLSNQTINMPTNTFSSLFFLFLFQNTFSQTVEISGVVSSKIGVENIHVINKTAQFFTITNKNGEFKISVRLNDTVTFSSIQHKIKTVVIDKNMLFFKAVKVVLDEQITELNEVLVGKVLTGNLLSDIKNTKDDAPINFYDVGIPGYTGKPATQSERRLYEATTGGGFIPLNPILNAISGRTKQLKNQIKVEEAEALMQSIKSRLSKDFFMSNPMEEDLKVDFFYFCADDENFVKYCKNQTDFKILIFLRQKYIAYMQNIETPKN